MSSTAKNRIVYVIISILILVTLMFVPVLGSGGIFPDEQLNYFDSVGTFFDYAGEILRNPFEGFPYIVMIFFSILWIVHFIVALTGSKGGFLTVSVICTILWAAPVVLFLTQSDKLGLLFDTKYGVYAIGIYVILLLFVVSLIAAAVSKSKKSDRPVPQYNPYGPQGGYAPYQQPVQNPYQPAQQPVQNPYQQPYQAPYQAPVQPAPEAPAPQPEAPATAEASAKFCPACGAPAEDGPFCGNCGAKL